jgi:3-hydroxyacyl-[acyl-carrier-protein] dehydratase
VGHANTKSPRSHYQCGIDECISLKKYALSFNNSMHNIAGIMTIHIHSQPAPDVLQAIPHRPPFLFVDRILEEHADRIIAERTIRSDEQYFQGHYPNNPIMPGVLLCESIFQTGAILLSHRLQDNTMNNESSVATSKTPVLARILEAKFKSMVRPGDVIQIEAQYIESMGHFHKLKGTIRSAGKVCVTLECLLAMVDADKATAS